MNSGQVVVHVYLCVVQDLKGINHLKIKSYSNEICRISLCKNARFIWIHAIEALAQWDKPCEQQAKRVLSDINIK